MIVKLFDLESGVLVPSIHCYSLKSLKDVMDTFPTNYLKIYKYVYYMTYPDPEDNPFFNTPEVDKEELILREVEADFSIDHPVITQAVKFCNERYDTPTKRAYRGMKIGMEKMAKFFETQPLSTGRDGSLTAMTNAMAKYNELWESFKGVEKNYNEEIKTVARGDTFTAYDQR